MQNRAATYQVDSNWKIIEASDDFCRALRCTRLTLLGRDIRDLLRADWRPDFRNYVVRALVGVGDKEVTLPMVAPCGEQGWYKHTLEPMFEDGVLGGYRASMTPHCVKAPAPARRWWEFRPAAPAVWNYDARSIGRVLVGG